MQKIANYVPIAFFKSLAKTLSISKIICHVVDCRFIYEV